MIAWKELPRPETPGPWMAKGSRDDPMDDFYGDVVQEDDDGVTVCEWAGPDARAIAALPEYVAEVDRLRAWLEWFADVFNAEGTLRGIQNGEWPDGRQP